MCATCRSRADTDGGCRSASVTSRPCAQVSISRAVAIEAALIGGPNQGSFAPSGSAASGLGERGPAARQRASSRAGSSVAPAAGGVVHERCPAAGPASATARREALGIGRGEQRLVVGPREVGDLVGDRPALGRCRRRARRCPRARRRRRRALRTPPSSASRSASSGSGPPCPPPRGRRRCRPSAAEPYWSRRPALASADPGRAGSRNRAPRRRAAVHRDRRRRRPPPATWRPAATPGSGRRRPTTTPSCRCWPPARRPTGCRSGRRSRSRSPARP